MQFNVISLFPEMFSALEKGVTGRALKEGIIQLQLFNPRNYTTDKHQSVDDRPYGGGPGMLMMVEPLQAAIHAAKKTATTACTTIYLSPQGKPFNQTAAQAFTQKKNLILVAGRYEGIDERLIEQEIDEEWSIGDYILTGGELPAMVMIDAITRLLPNVVHDQDSISQDAITTGLLKYPQYTRPINLGSAAVPEVLVSGHHQQIQRYRLKQALGRTWLRRPDLLAARELSPEERELLEEFIKEHKSHPIEK
jgi:tRNA (guanine37-N1)-methyltransferase